MVEGNISVRRAADNRRGDLHAGVLPRWASALPLWAGNPWLWVFVAPGGQPRALEGTCTSGASTRPVAWRFLAENPGAYPLIVLDARAAHSLPEGTWTQVISSLAPGGLLLACLPHDTRLPTRLARLITPLRPAGWHVIEPAQDGRWFLRPATRAMGSVRRRLDPPYSRRALLASVRSLFRTPGAIDCLPAWKPRSNP